MNAHVVVAKAAGESHLVMASPDKIAYFSLFLRECSIVRQKQRASKSDGRRRRRMLEYAN
jgi:hypothetical protein